MYNDKSTKSNKNYHKPQVKMTITEKNNRNYKETWANIGFNAPCPEDCEHEHPLTGKCMSHYDYQVWINRYRNYKK
tara:strand:+ start:6063 stop:6290 length:228 start_codon:yes stop_codon:yes gene_type:complete